MSVNKDSSFKDMTKYIREELWKNIWLDKGGNQPLFNELADCLQSAYERDMATKDAVIQTCVARAEAERERARQIGNVAALREELRDMCRLMESFSTLGDKIPKKLRALAVLAIFNASTALAAPARNCDKHRTEAEARKAFLSERCDHQCGNCTVGRGEDALCHRCGVDWLFGVAKESEVAK